MTRFENNSERNDDMKLSKMSYKPIRCVFYYIDGKVKMVHDQDKIDKVYEKGIEYVTMYNPTPEQMATIMSKVNEKAGNVTMAGADILECIKLLTDIELDLTDEEALEVINNPDELLEAIGLECNVMILNQIKNQLKETDAIASLPESVKIPLQQEIQAKIKEEEDKVKEQEAKEIEEQMKALQEQLKAIKGK